MSSKSEFDSVYKTLILYWREATYFISKDSNYSSSDINEVSREICKPGANKNSYEKRDASEELSCSPSIIQSLSIIVTTYTRTQIVVELMILAEATRGTQRVLVALCTLCPSPMGEKPKGIIPCGLLVSTLCSSEYKNTYPGRVRDGTKDDHGRRLSH